jgi:hypothetical protein
VKYKKKIEFQTKKKIEHPEKEAKHTSKRQNPSKR